MPGTRTIVITIILVAGLLPPGLYWYLVGRAPAVMPDQARALLANPANPAVLVDVRPSADYAAKHLDHSINWTADEIAALPPDAKMPAHLANRPILLICNSGWRSAEPAITLNRLSPGNVFSVTGGAQVWQATSPQACPVAVAFQSSKAPATQPFATHDSPPLEQWTAVITGFVIKPVYMLMSLAVAWVLRGRTSPDLHSLFWAMLSFFLGEAACAVNFAVYGERSLLFEYLHNFGMIVAFAFTIHAALEAIDLRLIHYSHPRDKCAALALCQHCVKYTPSPCGLRRVFLLIIPAGLVLALAPLCAHPRYDVYTTHIFGTAYSYLHEVIHQRYEIRLLPVFAIVLFALCFVILLFKEQHPVPLSKIVFAAGAGALSFSLFRLVILAPFHDNQVWFGAWEEVTELLYVLFVVGILCIFRQALFAFGEPAGD